MTAVKDFFFNDKLRGTVTTLILVSILIMVCVGYWFPKENRVDQETIKTLKDVTIQIERAASSLQKQSELTDRANRELTRQLEEMEHNRHENYKELLEKYGLEVPDLTKGVEFKNFNHLLSTSVIAPYRLSEKPNYRRSYHIPRS